ncbi:unannotated protein [freshwater metagenome]|uniref:Unannotated protein n=1 Tax=freshwater metagenome TaxID=449393 RepID=A0A6J7GKI7_9ZZZZ
MPIETRVSIVLAPCRAFTAAARWKGQAPQTATGLARVRASHCQLSNCSAGTIDSTSTGRASAAETSSRCRRSRSSSGCSSSASSSGAASAGRVAVYPAAATVASRVSVSTAAGSKRTVAASVA